VRGLLPPRVPRRLACHAEASGEGGSRHAGTKFTRLWRDRPVRIHLPTPIHTTRVVAVNYLPEFYWRTDRSRGTIWLARSASMAGRVALGAGWYRRPTSALFRDVTF